MNAASDPDVFAKCNKLKHASFHGTVWTYCDKQHAKCSASLLVFGVVTRARAELPAEASHSGGCAEQAGEPDESELAKYVECGVGGVVCASRVLRVCRLWLWW